MREAGVNQRAGAIAVHPAVARQPAGLWAAVLRALGRSRSALIGGVIVLAVVLVAILAPWLSPYDPQEIEVPRRLLGPSEAHPFGTDNMGRDILSRVIFGARISLLVGSLVVLCAEIGRAHV